MKYLLTALLTIMAFSATYVKGYTKRDGTYVQGHYRSDANSNFYDNYSSKGNVNPYTGTLGTKTKPSFYGKKRRARKSRFSY